MDEALPEDSLEAEVVLHVRRHLRDSVRSGEPSAAADLAMLFGLPREDGTSRDWQEAASDRAPFAAAAILRSKVVGSRVVLGSDPAHVLQCKRWLSARKEAESAYRDIIALDLGTLLTLSRARDVAAARTHRRDQKSRFVPVVIMGPTGTGKELLAGAIHAIWARERGHEASGFHPLHVAGMPSNLIYDELFGHEAGAYTGASKRRPGRIATAHNGTLFIDEIGDLPPDAQVAMLRFLQDGTLSALGRDDYTTIDVRVIAATWRDLSDSKVFRADLFHRLHAGSALRLEPLRLRRGPLRDVIDELLHRKGHQARPAFTHAACDALERSDWPGNLRELDGVLDEAISASRGESVRLEHLPSQIVERYLRLPLHDRAVGMLADDLDGGVSEELVEWRIERLTDSVRQRRVAEDGTESRRVHGFLGQILDPSAEHQAALRDAANAVALEDDADVARTLAEILEQVIEVPGLPAVVVDLARGAASAAREKDRTQRTDSLRILQQLADEQPWLRLHREIASLPILGGQSNGEVAQAIVFFLRLVGTIRPQAISLIRTLAQNRGAAGLINDAISALPTEAEVSERLVDKKKPRHVTKEEWKEVASRCSSLAEMSRFTGYSSKQIKKYIDQHGVTLSLGIKRA